MKHTNLHRTSRPSTSADLEALKKDVQKLGHTAVPNMLASKHGTTIDQVKSVIRKTLS